MKKAMIIGVLLISGLVYAGDYTGEDNQEIERIEKTNNTNNTNKENTRTESEKEIKFEEELDHMDRGHDNRD